MVDVYPSFAALYLNPLPPSIKSGVPPIDNSIVQVMKEASLLYCLPDNPFFGNVESINEDGERRKVKGGGHAVQEATYACESFYNVRCLGMSLKGFLIAM